MNITDLLPRANFPKVSGKYKMAQMIIDGEPFFRFAEYSLKECAEDLSLYWQSTTNKIIEKTAEILGRNLSYMQIHTDEFGQLIVPEKVSDWYSLDGAGFAQISVESKRILYFSKESCIYRCNSNPNFVEEIRPLIPDWDLPR